MLDNAKKVLRMITEKGYEAYIVGGYVRNYLLGIESNDIDITTNATPKELQEIFENVDLPSTNYGAVIINNHGVRYEITTFRKEISYTDNRKPVEIEYINDLHEDLLRRDFVINTICIDENGDVIDYLNGKDDLEKRIVRSVGDATAKLEQDSLRILRAIRFASTLNFELDQELVSAIIYNKHLLKSLSYNRKKEELDKIFSSSNASKGIELLLKFGLDKELELERLKNVKNTDSLIAVWSILNVVDIYPFTNSEKELIKDINEALEYNNYDPKVLYKYGLYVNQVAGLIKGLDKKKITELYNNLNIHSRKELDIETNEIINIVKKSPGEYIKDVYVDLESKVLYSKLDNNHDLLLNYIKDNVDKY